MQDNLAGIRREATYVYQLVEAVAESCEYEYEFRTFLEPSEEFFEYIRETGSASRQYLAETLSLIDRHPRYADNLRFGFQQLKAFWRELHDRVKQATEADTLALPVPLIQAAEEMVKQIPGLEKTKLVVFISRDLNYFQYRNAHFRRLAADLQQVAKQAPAFPEALALIGVPYSYSSRLYPNVLIFHELGHYVYSELNIGKRIASEVLATIRKTLDPELLANFDALTWIVERINMWSEELFCDLFAVSLVGPSYSFSTLELFDTLDAFSGSRSCQFSLTHPADAFRFRAMNDRLRDLGWWAVIAEDLPVKKKLLDVSAVAEEKFTFTLNDNVDLSMLLKPLFELETIIRDEVQRLTGRFAPSLENYSDWYKHVRGCLANAIVPSASLTKSHRPSDSLMLNLGHAFLYDGLEDLARTVKPNSSLSVEGLAAAARRVEMWMLKCIEDLALIEQSPGHSYERSITTIDPETAV